jgi:hypothetical protein
VDLISKTPPARYMLTSLGAIYRLFLPSPFHAKPPGAHLLLDRAMLGEWLIGPVTCFKDESEISRGHHEEIIFLSQEK